MRLTTLLMIALLGSTATADAQDAVKALPQIGPPLVFEVSLRRYGPDNFMSASAGDSANTGKFESYVSAPVSLCGLSASSTEPGNVPGVGWRVTGEVLSTSGGQMTARVDWQRMWDKGVRIQNGASGSRTVTLRAGERVELDRVMPSGQSACNTIDARLEAAVVSKPAYRLGVVDGTFAGARGGRGANTTTTTTGARSGRGVDTTWASGRGAGTTTTGARGGRGIATTTTTTGAQSGTTATTPQGTSDLIWTTTGRGYRVTGAASYEAELWLVHRGPDGVETVQQQTVRFGANGINYTFPAIVVQTPKGPITLDITGRLQSFVGEPPDANRANPGLTYAYQLQQFTGAGAGARAAETPQSRIMVTIGRRARASGPPLLDITGGSSIAMEQPKATDVLSFELPALQKMAEDLLKGHQFSLRLTVAPIAK